MGNGNLDVSGFRNVNVDDTTSQQNLGEERKHLDAVERKAHRTSEEEPKRRTAKKDKG